MTSNGVFGIAAALVLGMAVQARASVVLDLSFSDSANTVTGQFTADSMGGDEYHATSGTLDVSASSNPNLVGVYTLVAGGPGVTLSPSGSFLYNNILYSPGDPYVDYYGLLACSSASGVEINIWSDNGAYELWASQDTQNWILQDTVSAASPTTTSITIVPEAPTIIASTLLLLPFGASTLRILRKAPARGLLISDSRVRWN